MSGVFTILQNHLNLYHLLYSISSFILSIYIIIPLFYVHIILISFQFLISIFNIISGILLIINTNTHKSITILFIINIIFITSSFIILLFIFFSKVSTTDLENQQSDSISKKASDATLFDKNYSMEQNWINKVGEIEEKPQIIQYSNSSNTIPLSISHQSLKNKQHESLLMSLEDYHIDNEELKRSKSSSNINKLQIQKQRWKSINDEKQFLLNINESLLPSVLKQKNHDSLEDYENSMQGLEQIGSGFKPKHFNSSITLNDWDLNEYNKFRNLSDYNVVPGLHKIVGNLNLSTSDNNTFLIPPNQDNIIDNIDDLSEFSISNTNNEAAPSLHTFRKESGQSQPSTTQENEPPILPEPKTPPPPPPLPLPKDQLNISKNNSPIKKFLSESPKRIFRSNTTAFSQQNKYHHNHSNSIISLRSGISSRSRSNSPNKFKSTMLKLHKHTLSVPNFNQLHYQQQQQQQQQHSQQNSTTPSPQHTTFNSIHSSKIIEPIDLWEIHTTNFTYDNNDDIDTTISVNKINEETNESRVSSLPSQVLGEYDKEKWKQIKDYI
ncbi:hypothetical protein KGF54_005545 [Candida jiufengensis]|uniref:uncharacterized protein n=1 Tax=Candida jiufengensis TaxID=497108 RepID=UPI002224F794|nr:uncharacterized protein KGF54_005545 [Candida jiufengensis]KAI5949310.1 hypothetical protein KGF54_005545 [Candida jiufengensis]